MHTCCAPCSVYCIDSLRSENIEPTIFWYNPNIHPYTEYKARRDCLKDYAAQVKAEAVFVEDYGLDEFCYNVSGDLANRCVNYCYPKRLSETVRYAAEHGYSAFTTTLLVSPYQKHDMLKAICERLAEQSGVEFASAKVRPKLASSASIYKNIAAAFSPRRTAIKNKSSATAPIVTNSIF